MMLAGVFFDAYPIFVCFVALCDVSLCLMPLSDLLAFSLPLDKKLMMWKNAARDKPIMATRLTPGNQSAIMPRVKTVYTTTITQEARRRGIGIEVIDAEMPIFILKHGDRKIRCYNSLTDRVGAVAFYMAHDKHLTNVFLARYGFSVPRQIKYSRLDKAVAFLEKYKSLVVKPCREWGGRGVAVAVTTMADLKCAIERARKFSEDVVVEQYVEGVDHRLIVVDGCFVAAIRREPAFVVGNGVSSIRYLILQKKYTGLPYRCQQQDPAGCRNAAQSCGVWFKLQQCAAQGQDCPSTSDIELSYGGSRHRKYGNRVR